MLEELLFDVSWDEIYIVGMLFGFSGDYIDDELFVYQGEMMQLLQDYLMWQVELMFFLDIDCVIVIFIVDVVDDIGYFIVFLDEICESMGDVEVDFDEVEVVLKCIQCFDLVGVVVKDFCDCLLIQFL